MAIEGLLECPVWPLSIGGEKGWSGWMGGQRDSLVDVVEHDLEPDVLGQVELATDEPVRTLAMLRPLVGFVGALPEDVGHRLREIHGHGGGRG